MAPAQAKVASVPRLCSAEDDTLPVLTEIFTSKISCILIFKIIKTDKQSIIL